MHAMLPPPADSGKTALTAGFTLIEISIVMVIIGLIIGGVLVGKDLIHAAEVRKTITQKEKFDAAANTFLGKYNYLPGDLPNATNFGFSGGTGTGDGIIYVGAGYFDDAHNPNEYWFWQQLYEANLIAEKGPSARDNLFAGDATPTCPICNRAAYNQSGNIFPVGGWLIADLEDMPGYWTNWTDGPHKSFVYGGGTPLNKRAYILTSQDLTGVIQATITPADAFAIDSKLDDGLPLTGEVLAISNVYYGPNGGNCPCYFDAYTSTNVYNLTGDDTYQLDLIIGASF